nr:hypothetical protein [Tanacetum cinerariifolium]
KSYRDTAILKRRRRDNDDQERPSARSNRGRRDEEKTDVSSKSAFAEEPMQTTCQMDETPHLVFDTGAEDQPIVQTSQHPKWFSQPRKPPTPDRDWNKTLPAIQGNTLIDFSNFIMNRLYVDTLTPELLAGPTYELMKGSCTSLTELEYHLEEVYKATTDQLDWVNPEGQQYPHNLLQPLPLIPNNRGRRVIPFAHFINNDLEYLRGGTDFRPLSMDIFLHDTVASLPCHRFLFHDPFSIKNCYAIPFFMFISMPYTIARSICMHDYDMLSPSHGGTMTMTYEAPVS